MTDKTRRRLIVALRGEVSILCPDRNIGRSLRFADRASVFRHARMVLETSPGELQNEANYWELY